MNTHALTTALALGVLLLPATGHAATQSTHGTAAASAAEALGLTTVLDQARDAARRDAWHAVGDGLFMTGTTDAGGVDAPFELLLAPDGRYAFATEGRLAESWTFDGTDLWLRVRAGPTLRSDLSARESSHLAQWVHSGFWLDPACPLEIELLGQDADTLTLQLSFPGAPPIASLVLDRESWLPRQLVQSRMGADVVVSFDGYEEQAGIPLATRVTSVGHGEETRLQIETGTAAPTGSASRYSPSAAPPADVHFDPDAPAGTTLKRTATGHLLVHPLVDGQDVGWFLLDSGAGQICIDPDAADELELESFGQLPAVGVAGTVQTSYRAGESLQLGPMRLDGPVFVEIELSFLSPVFGVEVAGICGYDVFGRSVIELDLEEDTLALHDPATYTLSEGRWTPLYIDSRVPSIPATFEGDRSGMFRLDLGDTGTISFYSPAVEALGLLEGRELRASQVGGVGGMGAAQSGELEWFEVGGQRFEPLQVTFSQVDTGVFSSKHSMGNLGTSMLEPFRVVFDYAHSRIALVPRE